MNEILDQKISTHSLLKFSFPTIASMVFMGIYSSIDGVFVARLVGTDALSAVNIVMPLIMISLAIGMMMGSGGNAFIAKKLGEGKPEEARAAFSLILLFTFAISTILSVTGLIFLNPLLHILGANDSLMALCKSYAIPVLFFIPICALGVIFQTSFVTIGKASLGLFLSVLGGVLNIVLDYVFIHSLGMGVSGAAIATGIGYSTLGVAGVIYFLLNKKNTLYLVKPTWHLRTIKKSCSNGASEMVTSLSSSVVALLLNNILIRLAGADGVASITIILYAQNILGAAYMGYSFGIAPMISYNYGKQSTTNLHLIYKLSLKFIGIASITTFALSIIFAKVLVGIFATPSSDVYMMALRGFRMFCATFLFLGINTFSSALFTALSNGKVSAILSLFRTLIFIVVAVLALPLVLGLDGVWLAIPLAETLGFVMSIYYFKKMRGVYHY